MFKLPEDLENKYRFVTLASKRAEQLQTGALPRVGDGSRKSTVVAQEEVAGGLVEVWKPEEEALDLEERLVRLHVMLTGEALRVIPAEGDPGAEWSVPRELDGAGGLAALLDAQRAAPVAHYPTEEAMRREVSYNRVRPSALCQYGPMRSRSTSAFSILVLICLVKSSPPTIADSSRKTDIAG